MLRAEPAGEGFKDKKSSKNAAFIANVLNIIKFIEAVLNIDKKADIALPESQTVHPAF